MRCFHEIFFNERFFPYTHTGRTGSSTYTYDMQVNCFHEIFSSFGTQCEKTHNSLSPKIFPFFCYFLSKNGAFTKFLAYMCEIYVISTLCECLTFHEKSISLLATTVYFGTYQNKRNHHFFQLICKGLLKGSAHCVHIPNLLHQVSLSILEYN